MKSPIGRREQIGKLKKLKIKVKREHIKEVKNGEAVNRGQKPRSGKR